MSKAGCWMCLTSDMPLTVGSIYARCTLTQPSPPAPLPALPHALHHSPLSKSPRSIMPLYMCPAFDTCGHTFTRSGAFTTHKLTCVPYQDSVKEQTAENCAIATHAEKRQRLNEAGASVVSLLYIHYDYSLISTSQAILAASGSTGHSLALVTCPPAGPPIRSSTPEAPSTPSDPPPSQLAEDTPRRSVRARLPTRKVRDMLPELPFVSASEGQRLTDNYMMDAADETVPAAPPRPSPETDVLLPPRPALKLHLSNVSRFGVIRVY
jgi:hypothetical protein